MTRLTYNHNTNIHKPYDSAGYATHSPSACKQGACVSKELSTRRLVNTQRI